MYELDRFDDADSVLVSAIDTAPYTKISDVCRTHRTQISQKNLRGSVWDGLQLDVVMYCLAALEEFEKRGVDFTRQITCEVAMLGSNGLDINDPSKKYKLKSLSGDFSGLQLLCYMYAGTRRIDPKLDTGADFSAEYTAAESMLQAGNGS